jgi:signal transduction histidine kinase
MPVMGRVFSSRVLLAACGALMVLLAALAVLQYRWSARVAAADARRETESLESAAALFTKEISGVIAQATVFLQEDAWAAMSAGKPVRGVPDLLAEVYFLKVSPDGKAAAQRLQEDGSFTPSPAPDWLDTTRWAVRWQDKPQALITPIYDVQSASSFENEEMRILKTFRWRPDRFFAARLDESYLRETLFPSMIRRSFGASAVEQYDFAVASAERPDDLLYGSATRIDLRARFGATPNRLAYWRIGVRERPSQRSGVIVQHRERIIGAGPEPPSFEEAPGIWELQISRKGGPLADAFEQRRRRELLVAFGIEALLLAAVAFLVIGVRRMQRLADQKMQFVAGVSHELRTPVSAIAMLARNQADGLVTDPERIRQYGELIHQQSRRLNETVEQTLQFAGIHSGLRPAPRNPVALPPILEEVVDGRRREIEEKGFELELALDAGLPQVSVDAALIRTAVDNLLSNALKHAESGRWMRLSADLAAGAKAIRIRLEDRGPGVGAEDREEIFQPFRRGRAATDDQIPGSGLGLSLVRSAAEAHGGTVTLESEPGRGSVFTLRLPL